MNKIWHVALVAAAASAAFFAGRRFPRPPADAGIAVSGPEPRSVRERPADRPRTAPSGESESPALAPHSPETTGGAADEQAAPSSGEPEVPAKTAGPAPGNAVRRIVEDESEDEGDSVESDPPDAGDAQQGEERKLPGTDAEKIAALHSLAAFRNSQSASGQVAIPDELQAYLGHDALSDGNAEAESGDDGESGQDGGAAPDGDDGEDGTDDGGEDEGFRDTVNLLTLALQDDSPDVRDAAFDATLNLPEAERNLLSLQIMGNDDEYLKSELVKAASAATDEFSVSILMQALDDGGEGVSDTAAKRLEELFGRAFKSTADAMSWWESNRGDYEFPGTETESVDSGPGEE